MKNIEFKPIGLVHSPLKNISRNPVQSTFSEVKGQIEIFEEYAEGLKDLELFEYIICLAYFNKVRQPVPLLSSSAWDTGLHGIFSIRSPRRPNPIGFSIVRLTGINDNILQIEDVDIIDGTPLLDIKPYVPDFDWREADRIGWLSTKSKNIKTHRSDNRYNKG